MTKPDDSGPAFPNAGTSATGMTLRDWFAGQALAGLMADPDYDPKREVVAAACYGMADAMITARSRHGRPSGEA